MHTINQYEHDLVNDVLEKKITSPLHLIMKMQIAGVTPSLSMMYSLLGYSNRVHICDFLCNGITNNVFTEFIDDEFVKTIALWFNLKYFRKIGIAISKTAPGKLIRYYLNNKKTFKYNYGRKYISGIDDYEDFIYDLSTKISHLSQEFKEKHYEQIKSQYLESTNFKNTMK